MPADTVKARVLLPDGTYTKKPPAYEPVCAQVLLMKRAVEAAQQQSAAAPQEKRSPGKSSSIGRAADHGGSTVVFCLRLCARRADRHPALSPPTVSWPVCSARRGPRGRSAGPWRCCPDELPWQRVIREDGTIAGGEYAPLRRAMLEAEGVPFTQDGRVAIDRCRWQPGEAGLV